MQQGKNGKIDLEPATASIAFKGEPMTFPCSSGLNMCHQAASSLISWLCNVVMCVLGCPNGACVAHACHWHPFYFPYSLWHMALCMKMAAWGSVGWSLLKTNINSGPRRRQLQITGPTRSVQTWKCTSMPSDGHMIAHVIEIHCVINSCLWNIQIRYALQPYIYNYIQRMVEDLKKLKQFKWDCFKIGQERATLSPPQLLSHRPIHQVNTDAVQNDFSRGSCCSCGCGILDSKTPTIPMAHETPWRQSCSATWCNMHQDVYCGHLRAGGSAALFWPWMSKKLWLMKSIKLCLLVGMDMPQKTKNRKHHKIDI